MSDPKTRKNKPTEDDNKNQRQSNELDEELDESFPASDPPSSTQPAPDDD